MNLRELFSRYPLGCESFGAEWLRRWNEVGRLLDAPVNLQFYHGGCDFYGPPLHFRRLHEALADMRVRITAPNQRRVRIILLDGTVVREWCAS